MKKEVKIDRKLAAKILKIVDKGLSSGLGNQKPGEMCVEAAVCFAMGLPHGDNPPCVSDAVRALKIRLNDSNWSSKESRAKGMRRLAIAQLGTAGNIDDLEFVKRVNDLVIRKVVPVVLRSVASIHPEIAHKEALERAAFRCERDGNVEAANAVAVARSAAAAAAVYAARSAKSVADAVAAWSAVYAANAVYAVARSAAAAESAAKSAAKSVADAANAVAVAKSVVDAANAVYAVARSAAAARSAKSVAVVDAAKSAADAVAAWSARSVAKIRDKRLAWFAEEIVQILISMNAKGCEWLDLTEAA